MYYAPRVPVYNGATCPDIFGNFRLLRLVLLRERVTVVHAHQVGFIYPTPADRCPEFSAMNPEP